MPLSTSRRLVAAVALLVLAMSVGATAAEDELEATYYLHWDGCGAETETYLEFDVPASNGCGTIAGLPLNEAFTQTGDPLLDTYGTRGVQDLVLDTSRELHGEIHVHSWTGVGGAGLGQVVVDGRVTLRYLPVDAERAVSKSFEFSGEQIATPADDSVAVPFSFELPGELDGSLLKSVTLDLDIHGVHVDSGVQAGGGLSHLVVPHVAAPAVE